MRLNIPLLLMLSFLFFFSCKEKDYRYYFQEAKVEMYELRNTIKFNPDTLQYKNQYNVIFFYPMPYTAGMDFNLLNKSYASGKKMYQSDESLNDFKLYFVYNWNDTLNANTEISEQIDYSGLESIDEVSFSGSFTKQEIIARFNQSVQTIDHNLFKGIGIRFKIPYKPYHLKPVQLFLEAYFDSGKVLKHYGLIKHYRVK